MQHLGLESLAQFSGEVALSGHTSRSDIRSLRSHPLSKAIRHRSVHVDLRNLHGEVAGNEVWLIREAQEIDDQFGCLPSTRALTAMGDDGPELELRRRDAA